MEKTDANNTALALAFSCLLAISALSSTSLLPTMEASAQSGGSACPDGWVKSKGGECTRPATPQGSGFCPSPQRQFLVDGESVCTELVDFIDVAEGEECPEVDNAVVVPTNPPGTCLVYEIIGPSGFEEYICEEGERRGTNCYIQRGNR